jgi:hypothetical protein
LTPDPIAYRLEPKQVVAEGFVPIQVKARSVFGYRFFKCWFARAPGVILVHVRCVAWIPVFYVFRDLSVRPEGYRVFRVRLAHY